MMDVLMYHPAPAPPLPPANSRPGSSIAAARRSRR